MIRTMLAILIVALSLSAFAQDQVMTVGEIINGFKLNLDTINDYRCVLHDLVKKGNKSSENHWNYMFMKPKYIRMESFKGDREGSKAFFDCKTNKVTGRQGGMLSAVKLTLDLSSKLVKNIRGTTIAESDWFYVLERTQKILNEPGVESFLSKTKFRNQDVWMIHLKSFDFKKYNFDETKMFFNEEKMLIGIYNFEKKELVQDVHYYDINLNTGIVLDSMYVK